MIIENENNENRIFLKRQFINVNSSSGLICFLALISIYARNKTKQLKEDCEPLRTSSNYQLSPPSQPGNQTRKPQIRKQALLQFGHKIA